MAARKNQTEVPTDANVSQRNLANITRDNSIDEDERAHSQDMIGANGETNESYVQPPPKPSVLEELNAKLAPYLPPGSDKESAFFKTTSRADNEKIAQMARKGLVDVNYDPRMSQIKKKPLCLVKIEPGTTSRK